MKLLTPHITEKSYQGYANLDKTGATYTFIVSPTIDKLYVKKLVEREYKVSVIDVRIVNLPGKVRRFKGAIGFVPGRSKAIVRLKKGDQIAAFDIDTKDAKEEKKETKA